VQLPYGDDLHAAIVTQETHSVKLEKDEVTGARFSKQSLPPDHKFSAGSLEGPAAVGAGL
jgi:hypothetical protein